MFQTMSIYRIYRIAVVGRKPRISIFVIFEFLTCLLRLTLWVNFMMTGPKETAQND